MRKEIEQIYYNFERLNDDYRDLPEVEESKADFWKYISEQFDMDKRMEIEIDELLCACIANNERQGFIYGFEYAVRLLTCQKGGYDVSQD